MNYIFIFDQESKGWWLKIDSIEKLADYHEKADNGIYDEAIAMYLEGGHPHYILEKLGPEERIRKMQDKDFKRLQIAVMQAERRRSNIFDGFRSLNLEVGMGQMRKLDQYGAIYINCVGGYTFGLHYTQFCLRKELVFPNFKESDIRIKQFSGGKHFYAYIGDIQVRGRWDRNEMKWNSRDEAYNRALELIGEVSI